MSRLDRHITLVQSKLTLEKFLLALGYSVAAFFAALTIAVLVDRFMWISTPRVAVWSALGVAAAAAFVVALLRKPTAHQAAIFIDDKLGLNEKFSTALYARQQGSLNDPFAAAAVKDAERTADNVSLHKRFPIAFPRSGYFAMIAAVVVLLAWWLLPRVDLFGRQATIASAKKQTVEQVAARQQAEKVMASVSSLPKAMQAQQKVEVAKRDLKRALDQNASDVTELKLTAQKAQEEAEQAKQEEMKANQAFAQDLTDKAVFNSLNPSADDNTPVADASREMAAGNFAKAAEALKSIPDKFDKMNADEQKKTADAMGKMAEQLGKIASDPAAMQKLQQQLQQQGASAAQAQQIAKTAQQAAQGNPAAQQQLQKMQQQLQQQMNNGKGPTAQQQSAIAKAMQQMQSVAGSQSSAQQMANAAQQMAQGMQQAQAAAQQSAGGQKTGRQQASAKQGAQQAGGQAQAGGQQANAKAGGQKPGGQQPSGQQGGQQQGGQQQAAGGQQPGGKQPGGNQPGGTQANNGQGQGQGPGQGQQQMKQASQQMTDALDKMDATKKDAQQQVAEGDKRDGDAGNGQADGADKTADGGTGDGKQGDPGNKKGNGMGGPGIGQGGVGKKQLAQFTVKQEKDPSQYIASGKILAKTFVKADREIGKSTIELSQAGKAAVKESTDDVDGENDVPKDAQKMVKDYFKTMETTPQ